MLHRFLTSKRTLVISFLLAVVAGITVVFSLFIPTSRRSNAVQGLGQNTIDRLQALPTVLEYYDNQPLAEITTSPAADAYYKKLCGLLATIQQESYYDRLYLLYQGIGERINYLADSAYQEDALPMVDYNPIGSQYNQSRYTNYCKSRLEDIFAGKLSDTYIPIILQGNVIVSYLPITGADGTVIAVLGADSKLTNTNFSHFAGPVEFDTVTTASAMVFLISLLVFIAAAANRETEEEANKYYHNRKPNIVVDRLEDIDPNDYM